MKKKQQQQHKPKDKPTTVGLGFGKNSADALYKKAARALGNYTVDCLREKAVTALTGNDYMVACMAYMAAAKAEIANSRGLEKIALQTKHDNFMREEFAKLGVSKADTEAMLQECAENDQL